MMEPQVQAQEERWTSTGGKVSDSTLTLLGGSMSVEREPAREVGDGAHTGLGETMTHVADKHSVKVKDSSAPLTSASKDDANNSKASHGLNHSAASEDHSSFAEQGEESTTRSASSVKTLPGPDSDSLPNGQDTVTVSTGDGAFPHHSHDPSLGHPGEGGGADVSCLEKSEAEVSDAADRKADRNSMLEAQEVQEAASPKPCVDKEGSDKDTTPSCTSVEEVTENMQQGDTSALTQSGNAEDSMSASVPLPEPLQTDGAGLCRVEKSDVSSKESADGLMKSEEQGLESRVGGKEDSWVCEDEGSEVSTTAGAAPSISQEEDCVRQSAHRTDPGQSPPTPPQHTPPNTTTPSTGALPTNNTCRTDNIFEKFSSSCVLPSGKSERRSRVEEEEEVVCGEDKGKASQSQTVQSDDDRMGNSTTHKLGGHSEASSHHRQQQQQEQENQQPVGGITAQDPASKKSDRPGADCSRAEPEEDDRGLLDQDTHLKAEDVADRTGSDAFQPGGKQSPEACEGNVTAASGLDHLGENSSSHNKDSESQHVGSSDDSSPGSEGKRAADDAPLTPSSKAGEGERERSAEVGDCDQVSEDSPQCQESSSENQHKVLTHSVPENSTPLATNIGTGADDSGSDGHDESDDEDNDNDRSEEKQLLFQNDEDSREGFNSDKEDDDTAMKRNHGDEEIEEVENQNDDNNLRDAWGESASEADDSPGTPRFQLARTKTVKTYSKKSESKSLSPLSTPTTTTTTTIPITTSTTTPTTTYTRISSKYPAKSQPALSDPTDVPSDTAESEGYSSESPLPSPVIESAHSDSDEGTNDNNDSGGKLPSSKVLSCTTTTSLLHRDQLPKDSPPQNTTPTIVSRITKALTTSASGRDPGKGGNSPGRSFVMKLKPMGGPAGTQPGASEAQRSRGGEVSEGAKVKAPVHRCDLCGKTFFTPGRLKKHELHHQAGKHFCCDVCGKSFVDQEKLDFHHKVHTGSADGHFTCDQCGQVCHKWRSYVYHMQTHSRQGPKKYSCELCGHTLSCAQRLKRHVGQHKKGLHFCCYSCGKLYPTQGDRDRHAANHSKLTPPPPPPPPASRQAPPPPSTPTVPQTHTTTATTTTAAAAATPRSTVPSTPVGKRCAAESADNDQPAKKHRAVPRATRKQVGDGGGGGEGSEPPVVPPSPASSEEEEEGGGWGEVKEEEEEEEAAPTSGSSTPARGGGGGPPSSFTPLSTASSSASDGGEVRKSSRKRSHSRKVMCSCCPRSPSPPNTPSPSSVPSRNAKSNSGGGSGSKKPIKMRTECSSEKKRKTWADAEVPTERKPPAEEVSERRKAETFHSDLPLRECSIKLERSSSASPQMVSFERTLQASPKPPPSPSTKPPETVLETDKKPDPASPDVTPKVTETPTKKPVASDPTHKPSKRLTSELFGTRKVKIYRTASEKMLPKNLALSNASRERARKAAKKKQERAAVTKAERVVEDVSGAQRNSSSSSSSSSSSTTPKPPGVTKYPCRVCGESFRSDSDMKIHTSKHLTKVARKPVDIESVAQSCRLSFASRGGSPDKQGYVCHRCGFGAQGYADLAKHMWMHSPKPYQCSECCLAFSLPDTLHRHMTVHAKKK
ncbi:uncharacterized protein LOC143277935 [Babylonia areolata]|uniref:uncharacterized protein LOC143277935 n=1 Tax=Babylonia areolata TaxID=304850 RepID=UPI003FD17B60